MAAWKTFYRTVQGKALDIKVEMGKTPLYITKAMSGTGRNSDPTKIIEQTSVLGPKQTLILQDLKKEDEESVLLPITLQNKDLTEGYVMHQLGIYATDPDLGEILYTICQVEETAGASIPAGTENSTTIQWDHRIKITDNPTVPIIVSAAGVLTTDIADKRYIRIERMERGNPVPVAERELNTWYLEPSGIYDTPLTTRIFAAPNLAFRVPTDFMEGRD